MFVGIAPHNCRLGARFLGIYSLKLVLSRFLHHKAFVLSPSKVERYILAKVIEFQKRRHGHQAEDPWVGLAQHDRADALAR